MKIAIITGASSGIGKEFVRQLDHILHKVDEIWLIARREERLIQLAGKCSHPTRVLPLDLTSAKDMDRLKTLLEKEKPDIRMLVNCAGYGLMGSFSDLSLREQRGMLALNCMALTDMTYLCLPYMKRNSRIIQMASSAAFLPQPGFAIYAASKAYVLSFSRALSEELREQGIYVTAVCPGPVDTEFFDIAEQYGRTLSIKKLTMVNAERVVREALHASARKQPVSVCSIWIKAFRILSSLLPHSLILRIMRFVW